MTILYLTQRAVESAKPRRKTYIIHDKKLKGFHLSVARAGRKTFALSSMRYGKRIFEKIGDAAIMPAVEARKIASQKIKTFTEQSFAIHHLDGNTRFEAIAELTFDRYERLWKPNTTAVNRCYLHNNILPYFKDHTIAAISRQDVERWFAGLRHIAATANRAAPVLSAIMRQAEELGCRPEDSNPVLGLRRYPKHAVKRILTADEMARLGAVLKIKAKDYPLHIAALRLIMFTGCRKSEILNLRWKDYKNGHLYLPDSKTGPKTVFLSSYAQTILKGVKTHRSQWIFPAKDNKPIPSLDYVWGQIRKEAYIEDVRIHDFRHHYASIAIRHGESLKIVGNLLGHRQPETTLRYIHLDDETMLDAVQIITASMKG